MRLFLSALLATAVHSFSFQSCVPHQTWGSSTALRSTVEAVGSDIVAAYESQMAKMREKDQTSKALSKEVSFFSCLKVSCLADNGNLIFRGLMSIYVILWWNTLFVSNIVKSS